MGKALVWSSHDSVSDVLYQQTDEEGVFGSPRLTSLSVLSPIPASPQSSTVPSTISTTPFCPVTTAARRQRWICVIMASLQTDFSLFYALLQKSWVSV